MPLTNGLELVEAPPVRGPAGALGSTVRLKPSSPGQPHFPCRGWPDESLFCGLLHYFCPASLRSRYMSGSMIGIGSEDSSSTAFQKTWNLTEALVGE